MEGVRGLLMGLSATDCVRRSEQSRQFYRVLAAVFLSLIFHLSLISVWWRPLRSPSTGYESEAISVTLVRAKGVDVREKPARVRISKNIADKKSVPEQQSLSSRAAGKSRYTDSSTLTATSSRTPIQVTNEQQTLPYGVVVVLLTLTPAGQVKAITWTQLPPITEARLLMLEATIRSKTYLASDRQHVVREIVDVLEENKNGYLP